MSHTSGVSGPASGRGDRLHLHGAILGPDQPARLLGVDLHPWDAGAWQHLKRVELRNAAFPDLEELHLEFHLAIGRLRKRRGLIRSFFEAAGLGLEKV